MITFNLNDLSFILRQIKISEALTNHTLLDGTPFAGTHAELIRTLIFNPHLPWGLRTVSGIDNNISQYFPDAATIGAADTVFPRLLDPNFLPAYAGTGPAPVIDGAPRTISNLISDQTVNNAAALEAWQFAHGLSAADLPGQPNVADPSVINPPIGEIPNIAPDTGISAPFNSWMTMFGQFFDHGLDLVTKGGAGVVLMPLAADDPLVLVGPNGIAGDGDEVPVGTPMALTRASVFEGPGADRILVDDPGTAVNEAADNTFHEAQNTTTSWIDQNQTYTSHPSHQVFLREYVMVGGQPLSTGKLLDNANDAGASALPTWAQIKAQARDLLGIDLQDADITNLPLLRTDEYGEFIRDPATGLPLIVTNIGLDGIPNTADDITTSGNLATPVSTLAIGAVRTGHAFLDDIAHNAGPRFSSGPNVGQMRAEDADSVINGDTNGNGTIDGAEVAVAGPGFYDDELLDGHFITGDGRGNENIALTAVHHVFHAEHNRLVEHTQATVLASGDRAFINEWLLTPIGANDPIPTSPAGLTWDGERLFQAARFGTEMQYQHLVFEEFARKVQPAVDLFVFNSVTDIDPSIVAEFAHAVYRFGHSMLTDVVARIDPVTGASDDISLIEAFLNPIEFNQGGTITADQAAAAIINGMTRQAGNEIDEFVVDAVRNNLLGRPIDLPALNLARGRDTGMPSLNDARAQLYEAANPGAVSSSFLKPYASWIEFMQGIKNPASVVNFIAAYGTHDSITSALTLEEKRDAAFDLVYGGVGAPADRAQFMTSTGTWANGDTTHPTVDRDGVTRTGLGNIDLWIGGLAEKIMPFGGMLGSTFNAVFEYQLESLQQGDRFYYLTRNQGLNFINELENNSFANLVLANTALGNGAGISADNAGHLPGDLFATVDHILEIDISRQIGADPTWPEGTSPSLANAINYVERDNPNTLGADTNYLEYNGAGHVVLGGTNDADILIASEGDDTIWGDGGNDRIEGGAGIDRIHGGDGDDIIEDSGDADFIHGENGNDVISGGNGLDLLFGGRGMDMMIAGIDATEVFGDEGDDFVLGGNGADFLAGNEGNDWLEGQGGFDTIAGDNSELFFNSTVIGHDVMFAGSEEMDFDAESGDDIMVQGPSVIRNEGMLGFDWSIFLGSPIGADADLRRKIFTTEEQDILRNRFDRVEALSGSDHDDLLLGDSRVQGIIDPLEPLAPENIFDGDELLAQNVSLINGFEQFLGGLWNPNATVIFDRGNILIGGDGSDQMQGNGGDDIIDGDAWLNVRISIVDGDGNEVRTVNSLTEIQHELLAGVYNPAQLRIVRELLNADGSDDADIAVFRGLIDEYTIEGRDLTTGALAEDLDGDGFISVTHVGTVNPLDGTITPPAPILDDGTDLLRNIERLRFLGGEGGVATEIGIGNSPGTGRPGLQRINQANVFVGVALGIGTLADADVAGGLTQGMLTFFWEMSSDGGATWELFASGANLSDADMAAAGNNQHFRGGAEWTDDFGATERMRTAQVVLSNNDGVTILNGGLGQQVILGTPLSETLFGGDGDDVLDGNGGADKLLGQDGDDELFIDDEDVQIDGGGGIDTAVITTTTGSTRTLVLNNIEIVEGSQANDWVSMAQASTGVVFRGYGGNDHVTGSQWADQLFGGDDNDQLFGMSGADKLYGGSGNDHLDGGAGQDQQFGGTGNDTIVWDAGDDLANVLGGEDYDDHDVDTLSFTGGTAPIAFDLEAHEFEQAIGVETDTGNQAAWNTITETYTSDWELAVERIDNDNLSFQTTSWDVTDSLGPTHHFTDYFDTSHTRTAQEAYNEGPGYTSFLARTTVFYESGAANYIDDFNSSGQRTSQEHFREDGTRDQTTVWDVDNLLGDIDYYEDYFDTSGDRSGQTSYFENRGSGSAFGSSRHGFDGVDYETTLWDQNDNTHGSHQGYDLGNPLASLYTIFF